METLVPAEYFTPEMVTKNGSYVYGIPIKEGKTVATVWYSQLHVLTSHRIKLPAMLWAALIYIIII